MNELKINEKSVEELNKEGEKAATFVEYILLVSLIAIAAIAILTLFGNRVSTRFSQLGSAI